MCNNNNNTTNKTQWKSLQSIPMSKYPFRIAFNDKTQVLYVIYNDKGIMKYSVLNDTWMKYQMCNHYDIYNQFFRCVMEPTLIDSNNTLYMLNTFGVQSIASINLNSNFCVPECPKKWRIKNIPELMNHNNVHIFPDIPKAVIIYNKIHFVSDCKHLMYDPNTFDIFTLNNNIGINYCSNLLKLKDKLIAFGAYDGHGNFSNDLIEYDIYYNKWSIRYNFIPTFINAHIAVTILNDQFIILFGGYHKSITNDASIWYCTFSNMTHFTESIVKCPGDSSRAFVFTFHDAKYDELIVFSFIKVEWNESAISKDLFPPNYIVKLMQKYYMNQWIHFIDLDPFGNKGLHWKIDVFDILRSI